MRLRDRMLEDLKLAGYSPATMGEYERCVRKLVDFVGKPPRRIEEEDVRRFLLHLTEERGLSPSTQRVYVCAFLFFFRRTVRRPDVVAHLPLAKVDAIEPDVLSRGEVHRVLAAADNLLILTVVALIYDTGLRLQEVRMLMPDDVDSDRMLIHVRQAKGRHGRYVPIGERLLACLRDYYRVARPTPPWLFAGRSPGQPVSRDTLQRGIKRAGHRARIGKPVTPHILRHTFATHVMESDSRNIHHLQLLLGHRSIRTTMRYLHLSRHKLCQVKSPLDTAARSGWTDR
ncbi:MAG: tyrosine-type recombinase/integrase [Myxococcota bacterium]